MGYERILGILEEQGFLMMDGALGTELERKGIELDPILWSAGVLRDDPAEIQKIHESYLLAGADCITTASYQLSYEGGRLSGLSEKQVDKLILDSVLIAKRAIKNFIDFSGNPNVLKVLAASIGPYGAFLADGAEYRGDYKVELDVLSKFHSFRLDQITKSDPDVVLFETIPSYDEARVIASLIEGMPEISFWVSFQCRDGGHLADGTPLEDGIMSFRNCENLMAIGANCIPPSTVGGIIDNLSKYVEGRDIIIYPNLGGCYDADSKAWDFSNPISDIVSSYLKWHEMGVRILGGCCGIGPAEIGKIKKALLIAR